MALKPAMTKDRDSSGVPFGGSRIGTCGDCGDHVMAGGGHPVPLPPKCAGCGAEPIQPFKMKKATGKAATKTGWLPKKRTNIVADKDSDGY